jgi:hypothetical protein
MKPMPHRAQTKVMLQWNIRHEKKNVLLATKLIMMIQHGMMSHKITPALVHQNPSNPRARLRAYALVYLSLLLLQ